MLCKLNYNALKDIYAENLFLLELSHNQVRGLSSVRRAFSGYIDGIDNTSIEGVLRNILDNQIDKVFIDGSNLGELVRLIKENYPHVEVCTFFHNVESRFFLGSLRQKKTVRSLAVLVANYLAERKAVRYSDKIICLSRRDSQLLEKVYGRRATHIAPMAVRDQLPRECIVSTQSQLKGYLLFVGGGFYANKAGILWFVENVVPRISVKTVIVGRGLEDLRAELSQPGKVEVIGEVESLADWYRDALLIIAPIFDGSGMKTKVAEALMYGKKVVGTPEAFSGYEDIASEAGWICRDVQDFVNAIGISLDAGMDLPCPKLRAIYEEKYSFESARGRLTSILSDA